MSHPFMNPFWFAPVCEPRVTKPIREWLGKSSDRLSGRIELGIRVLTPLHLTGEIEVGAQRAMTKRWFHRRAPNGPPTVEGTSIRGAIRGYLDALIGTPLVRQEPRQTDDQPRDPLAYHLDLVEFLLGRAPAEEHEDTPSWRGRVHFEDVTFPSHSVAQLESLDLADEASFGAPNPKKTNWWYYFPASLRFSRDQIVFEGRIARGRKLYFHQDPVACIDWYRTNWTWQQNLRRVATECVSAGGMSEPFVVSFEDVGRSELEFLLHALFLPRRMRHKLGALRPFGFGSIEFVEPRVLIDSRDRHHLTLEAESSENPELTELVHAPDGLAERIFESDLVFKDAIERLELILHVPRFLEEGRVPDWWRFVYPPWGPSVRANPKFQYGFAKRVGYDARRRDDRELGDAIARASSGDAAAIAHFLDLCQQRGVHPIDIDHYQTTAENYPQVVAARGA